VKVNDGRSGDHLRRCVRRRARGDGFREGRATASERGESHRGDELGVELKQSHRPNSCETDAVRSRVHRPHIRLQGAAFQTRRL
jgi:hypothetical protein